MVSLLSGRILVTLDVGKNNVGRIVQSNCSGFSGLMIPRVPVEILPGEEAPPIPEQEYYDHIIFVGEMSDEVEIDNVSYFGMKTDAILAVIPD